MLGSEQLEAADILDGGQFPGMILPSNAYPEGLNSVPEDLRAEMHNAVLTTEPSPKTQHYFVAGGTFGREKKRTSACGISAVLGEQMGRWCEQLFHKRRRDAMSRRIYEAEISRRRRQSIFLWVMRLYLIGRQLDPTYKKLIALLIHSYRRV
jgi:hypothetical protein